MNVDSLRHLQISLSRIDGLIRAAVVRARAAGHDPTDALRGLIISQEEIEGYLEESTLLGLWEDGAEPPDLPAIDPDEDQDLPFLHLIRAFHLTQLDAYILLLCLAPELDRRYERLYGYLQDDVSQRRPTVNLMMNLLGVDIPQRFAIWERLALHAPLRKHHLIDSRPDPNRHNSTFLAHHLKADHRIIAYLLGDHTPDERLFGMVQLEEPDPHVALDEQRLAPIREALPENPMVYMLGKPGMGQRETAAALCEDIGLPLIRIDMTLLAETVSPFEDAWRIALREGYLQDTSLLIEGWESCINEETHQPSSDLWTALQEYPRPVFICGEKDWEPLDIYRTRRMLRMGFEIPAFRDREYAWEQFTRALDVQVNESDITELASKFRFTRTQIARAVHTATDIANSRGERARKEDLYAGAQAHASIQLGHLAKRIFPRFTWDELILPPEQLTQLQEITARARFGHVVRGDWNFRKISRVTGVSSLFAGESGTGKTLAAEVIANDLGLVLYKIDLSAVVSKYIGETEKNLNVIFSEAKSSNAILFFDEADALFGKRSEVKDARDRYANIEIAYLLQQIEDYDGIAIMATNLRQNLDEAFTRRLDFLVDFPFPESEYRERIWQAHFPSEAPLSSDVDLAELANHYRLTGGNIRNAAVAAAYLAAADGGVITLAHIRSAIRREHQKMGRLLEDTY